MNFQDTLLLNSDFYVFGQKKKIFADYGAVSLSTWKLMSNFFSFFFWSSINCHIGKYVFYGTVTLELLMMNFRVYSECGNKIGILIFCIMYSSLVCTYLRLLISFDITFFLCVCLLLDRWHVDLWDTKTSEISLCPCGLCSLMGKYSSL